MLFERGEGGAFRPPQDYLERALVSFSTHDLATFAGWASGRDLAAKRALGLDPGETAGERNAAVMALRLAIVGQGLADSGFASVVAFLARAPAKLLVVALEDALGMSDQFNIPGTIDEHPNWRRKYPLELESMPDSEALGTIARRAAEQGRGPRVAAQLR
jgi:4-alpha-glucanotransferase